FKQVYGFADFAGSRMRGGAVEYDAGVELRIEGARLFDEFNHAVDCPYVELRSLDRDVELVGDGHGGAQFDAVAAARVNDDVFVSSGQFADFDGDAFAEHLHDGYARRAFRLVADGAPAAGAALHVGINQQRVVSRP